MGIQRVTVTRSVWNFGRQCTPAGATVDAGGGLTNRMQTAVVPRCVAVAIAADSEVRAVRIGVTAQPFDTLAQVIEGAPALFAHRGGVIDLARYDWTDGRLILEVAETPDDIAYLSQYVASHALITLTSEDTAALALNVYIQAPRAAGTLQVSGIGKQSGGVAAAFQRVMTQLNSDRLGSQGAGLGLGATGVLSTSQTSLAASAVVGWGPPSLLIHSMPVGSGVIDAQLYIRAN